MHYPDTSFLVSLYLNDQNGEKATAYAEQHGGPFFLTPLVQIEMSNAFRLWPFRKIMTSAKVKAVFQNVTDDIKSGFLKEIPMAWTDVLIKAEQLSAHHTPKTGNRTLDILHVAAAIILGADTFLTFDNRQKALAKLAKLTVAPQ